MAKDQEVLYSEDKQLNTLLTNVVAEVKNYAGTLLQQIKKLSYIGKALSAERNLDKLLEMILDEARLFTNADAGTLYALEDNVLNFKIIQNDTLKIRMGGTSNKPITFPPVELKESNVSGYVALKSTSVNIPDVYHSDLFDFTGPKKFDKKAKYRTKSMLVVPMKNHENDVIGVLQLINAKDIETGEVIPFSNDYESLTYSLSSQAAVAITNVKLIQDMEHLFSSFVKVMATAIDEKSPVTGGHIKRVADMTMVMAKTVNDQKEGPFADIYFDKDHLYELKTAAWMHDIGKVTTPVQIAEKGNKLEAIFDRIHYLSLKFLYFAKDVEAEGLKKKTELLKKGAPANKIQKLEEETEKKIQEIMDARKFVVLCNEPGEFMDNDKMERLKQVAKMNYPVDGQLVPIINEDELLNLSVRKGSITETERYKMQDHASVTLKMLEQIPFTKKLQNIPRFAGAHHEFINGKGYPKGLKGDEIPIEARMLAILDIMEALTATDRPYKKAMPLAQAYKILGFMVKDGELDGQLVDLLIKNKVYERYLEEYGDQKSGDREQSHQDTNNEEKKSEN